MSVGTCVSASVRGTMGEREGDQALADQEAQAVAAVRAHSSGSGSLVTRQA